MSSRHLASSDDGKRGRAVERLLAAVAERRDSRKGHESEEQQVIQATAPVLAAVDQGAARESRLEPVDDHGY